MQTKIIMAPVQGHITLETIDLPPLEPQQVLVEMLTSAISPGTELAWLHHKPNTPGNYPYYPGYCACGIIIEKGAAVTDLNIGQRVVCMAKHAAHAIIDASRCTLVPDEVSDQEAAIHTLVSIVLQGVRKLQLQLGWSVAVLGLGPIGNLAGQVARAAGATHVEGIDPVGWRRELALTCGFDAAADSADHAHLAEGYEATIEATGVPAAVLDSFALAKRLGHVVLLASTRGETESVNFYRDVHKKGLTIFGAHDAIRPAVDDHLFYVTRHIDTQTALKLLATGRVQVDPIISDVVTPADAASAYARLTRWDEELMLIVFDWKG
jgi:2-desacetyl-2-hydroxyethyl bacteriochlorophyllide A dehydrogenase